MTDRQAEILATIVEAYAEVSHPIGSVTLAKLFNVASSTIRGEMFILESQGYLKQPHTSAGRIPTEKGYRWYVNRLSESDQTSPKSTDGFKVLNKRIAGAGEPDQAIKSAMDSLSELTSNAGFGTLGDHLYTSGLSYLLSQPEFSSPATVQSVAYLVDNLEILLQEMYPAKSINVLIGRENPVGKASGCSLIVSKFSSPYSPNSYIGIIGSTRQNYKDTIALVKHAGHILEDSL